MSVLQPEIKLGFNFVIWHYHNEKQNRSQVRIKSSILAFIDSYTCSNKTNFQQNKTWLPVTFFSWIWLPLIQLNRADTAENSWKFPKKVLKKDPKIGPNRTKKGPFSVVLGSQRGLFTLSSLFPSKKSTNSVQNWFSG